MLYYNTKTPPLTSYLCGVYPSSCFNGPAHMIYFLTGTLRSEQGKGDREELDMATFEDFLKLDIRVGTVIEARIFEKAKKPAYQLRVDFGEGLGIKQSSAQITERYRPEDLIGKQVLAVVNFPPRQIANFMSEVLVLGTYSEGGVILIRPDKDVKNGDRLG